MTKPLADYYGAQGKLSNFAGETSDEIYPKIHAEMSKWWVGTGGFSVIMR